MISSLNKNCSDHSIAGEGFAASYMILNATTSCGGAFFDNS